MKKKIIILLVIAVLVLAYFGGLSLLGFGRVDIEPKTQSNWRLDGRVVGNYDGTNHIRYELITNPVGNTNYRSAFLLAKTPNGESEFITANGQMWYGRVFFDTVLGRGVHQTGWYVIKHKSPGDLGWRVIADNTGNKVNWLNYNNPKAQQWVLDGLGFWQWGAYLPKNPVFSIIGDHPGAIRIELVTMIRWDWFGSWQETVLSSDEAEILPSGGLIERTSDRATYEVGETMQMRVATDFSGSTVGEQAKGYQVKIRNPDGKVVWIEDLQDDWDGTISVKIEDDWYDPGWSNRFTLELVNQMRDLGVVSFFTIDVLGKAPANCSITANDDNGKVEGGTGLSVTFTAPEKEGSVEIEKFKYCMFYGQSSGSTEPPSDSSAWIQKWIDVSASKSGSTYSSTVVISIPEHVGYATILGVSIGEGNRASEIITPYGVYVWVADEPDDDQLNDDDLGPGDAYTGGPTTHWYDWILLRDGGGGGGGGGGGEPPWAIIIAIVVFAVFCIIGLLAPFPKKYGTIGTIGFVVVGIILAVLIYLGIIPIG